jgi:hypothetical protein
MARIGPGIVQRPERRAALADGLARIAIFMWAPFAGLRCRAFEVKKPEESKYPGDDYKLRAAIPADEAFRPLKDGGCPLING